MPDPSKELVSLHQANLLMLALMLLAPLVGLAWGAAKKRPVPGLVIGLMVGVGNYALWTLYNIITEHLGLDTVRNLMVNLSVFIVLGFAVGIGASAYSAKGKARRDKEQP